jgi:hypothetical protein
MQLANGIMEGWKNGIMGIKSLYRSFSAKPGIPAFHYSGTPYHLVIAKPVISIPILRTTLTTST